MGPLLQGCSPPRTLSRTSKISLSFGSNFLAKSLDRGNNNNNNNNQFQAWSTVKRRTSDGHAGLGTWVFSQKDWINRSSG